MGMNIINFDSLHIEAKMLCSKTSIYVPKYFDNNQNSLKNLNTIWTTETNRTLINKDLVKILDLATISVATGISIHGPFQMNTHVVDMKVNNEIEFKNLIVGAFECLPCDIMIGMDVISKNFKITSGFMSFVSSSCKNKRRVRFKNGEYIHINNDIILCLS